MPQVPLFHPATGASLVRAPGSGEGWWAGAPSRADWRGLQLLTYRLRAPRPRRGYAMRIARLDGYRVVDLYEITASQIASPSLERACLVARGQRLHLYLSSVDRSDGRWRIDLLTAGDPTTFDPTSRRTVLSAASTGTEGIKDPVVTAAGDGLAMYASIGLRADTPDHTTGDVFGWSTPAQTTFGVAAWPGSMCQVFVNVMSDPAGNAGFAAGFQLLPRSRLTSMRGPLCVPNAARYQTAPHPVGE